MNCIFCKIINKEIPSTFEYEDDDVIAFNDIAPKAPVHILVIPKKHIESIKELQESDVNLIGKVVFTAKKIAEEKMLAGYKLIFNVGREGGQLVDHIHLHLLGGRPFDKEV